MTSREERIQQRLRGAQRRQIKDVDFGLVFPAAFQPRPQTSVQQPSLSNQPETIPAPSLASIVDVESTPANLPSLETSSSVPKKSAEELSKSGLTLNANTSRKRRKLDRDRSFSATPLNQRSQRRDSEGNLSIRQDNVLQETIAKDIRNRSDSPEISIDGSRTTGSQSTKSSNLRRTPAKPRIVEEVTESPSDAPGSGQRVRLDNSLVSRPRSSNVSRDISEQPDISTPLSPKKGGRDFAVVSESAHLSRSPYTQRFIAQTKDYELDELSPERDEKSKNLQERHSSEVEIPSPESNRFEVAESIDDEQMVISLSKYPEKQDGGMRLESPDLDTPIVYPMNNSHKASSTQLNPSPIQVKRTKQKTKSLKSKKLSRKKPCFESTIPITVHRLTNPKIYDNECHNTEILNMEMPHIRRNDVNVMDVLSQICLEVIESELNALSEQAERCKSSSSRREFRAKRQALEVFQTNLQTRILEYSLYLDNSYSLEHRLRDEQKKKIRLREEVLRVRHEREQVALQMDEVRAQHQKARNEGMAQDNINDALHQVDLAVDTVREKFPNASNDIGDFVGTELLVKLIAQDVSVKGTTAGMLTQVKEFNEFLERASLALESKMCQQ